MRKIVFSTLAKELESVGDGLEEKGVIEKTEDKPAPMEKESEPEAPEPKPEPKPAKEPVPKKAPAPESAKAPASAPEPQAPAAKPGEAAPPVSVEDARPEPMQSEEELKKDDGKGRGLDMDKLMAIVEQYLTPPPKNHA